MEAGPFPSDHLAWAEKFAQRQQRGRPIALAILSPRPIGDLVEVEAPICLDRELASGASSAVRQAGFGREVPGALAARRQRETDRLCATSVLPGWLAAARVGPALGRSRWTWWNKEHTPLQGSYAATRTLLSI